MIRQRSSLVFVLLLFASVTQAITISVPKDQPTIQNAIYAASDGDEVIVSTGIYKETITLSGKNIILRSINPTDKEIIRATIIDGNGKGSVITLTGIEDETCVLSGFTITNGNSINGGGINGNGSSAIIEHCLIIANSSISLLANANGGGIYGSNGIIQYNTIRGNSVEALSGSRVTANGGAISDCNGIIRNNIITNNFAYAPSAGANGGGLAYCDGIIENNIIANNAVSAFWDTFGGGLAYCDGYIINNTIVYNELRSRTGLPNYQQGSGLYHCKGTVKNSIIWDNLNGLPIVATSTPSYSCVEEGVIGIGLVSENPQFIAPQSWDFRLDAGSPCIDAGDNRDAPRTDLIGTERILKVDIGAYEWTNLPLVLWSSSQVDKQTTQLKGKINSNGAVTEYYFEYGKTNGYGLSTNVKQLTGEFANLSVSEVITDLEPNQTYHFRLNAQNNAGLVHGINQTFTSNVPVIYVPGDQPTIQDAVDFSKAGDTIIIADGIYIGSRNQNINFQGKPITVRSENGANRCVINCEGLGQGFIFHNSETTESIIAGLTITNGRGSGGAISCIGASPTIRNCRITNNTATGTNDGYGGGIYCRDANPVISNCEILDNDYGGGIYCIRSSPKISDCKFLANNTSMNGGGIRCDFSSPVITNSIFTSNTAEGNGGAIYCQSSSPTITNSVFTQNSARYGGAIAGLIYSMPSIVNCTITANTATAIGGAVHVKATSYPQIINTLIWNNTPDEIHFEGNPLPISYSNIKGGYKGTGNINTNPIFVDQELSDYRLVTLSKCIGSASFTFAPPTDLLGDLRQDPPTIGAYEVGVNAPDQYKIRVESDVGGLILPSGEVPVNRKMDQLFTIKPNDGYYLADVEVDGGSVGTITEYTFNKVRSNHTIFAKFISLPQSLSIKSEKSLYKGNTAEIYIDLLDINGNKTSAVDSIVIELKSTSENATFSVDINNTIPINEIIIPEGEDSANFFYTDLVIGTSSVTVTAKDLRSVAHELEIKGAIDGIFVAGSPVTFHQKATIIAQGRPDQRAAFSIANLVADQIMVESTDTKGKYLAQFTPVADKHLKGNYDVIVKIGKSKKTLTDGIVIETTPIIKTSTINRNQLRNGQLLMIQVEGNRSGLLVIADISELDSTAGSPIKLSENRSLERTYSATFRVHDENEHDDGVKTIKISAQDPQGNKTGELAQKVVLRNVIEFELNIPKNIGLIHVPIQISQVNGQPAMVKTIGDLYNILGGFKNVNFLIAYDHNALVWRSFLGDRSYGKLANQLISETTGIISVMRKPVSLKLVGRALGKRGGSRIKLYKGLNLIGLPLDDNRFKYLSGFLKVNGIGKIVKSIVASENGTFRTIARSNTNDELVIVHDIPIEPGKAVAFICSEEGAIDITGEAWDQLEKGQQIPASPTTIIEPNFSDTPILIVHGLLPYESGMTQLTVKNLSKNYALKPMIINNYYQASFINLDSENVVEIGDIIEISASKIHGNMMIDTAQHVIMLQDIQNKQIRADLAVVAVPKVSSLSQNFPNPFNPETWIHYQLPEPSDVKILIYDVSGMLVRQIAVGLKSLGTHVIYWDGRSTTGEQMASGVYYYHLDAGKFQFTRKMTLLK